MAPALRGRRATKRGRADTHGVIRGVAGVALPPAQQIEIPRLLRCTPTSAVEGKRLA